MSGWRLPSNLSALGDMLKRHAADDQDRWVLWIPAAFGGGILIYFALDAEPAMWVGPAVLAFGLGILWVVRRSLFLVLICGAVAVTALGFTLTKLRSDTVAAPVLQKPTGALRVEGMVTRLERFPDRPRVLLERIQLSGRKVPAIIPERVLLRLRPDADVAIGMRLSVPARLLPPPAPVEPGGFDYQRRAWFEGIGATGYAVGDIHATPAEDVREIATRLALDIGRLRQALADRIQATLSGTAGALAVALIVGDRSAVPEDVTQALRDSGLAHLLAISGLHIGLVASLIFFSIRAILAMLEPIALRIDVKKVAAVAALAASFVYLLISGATVPTQRAFIMGGLVLCALMLDRKAISLRLVATAALIVLALAPESILSASFQMSFAAVVALVALYEAIPSRIADFRRRAGLLKRIGLYFLLLSLTTLVAGFATGIIGCYHFERITHYSLISNLLAIPLTAMWIMPMAVLAFVLMPFGLDGAALQVMGLGIDLLTEIAFTTAGWPAAVSLVPAMPLSSFLMLIGGGLWLCLMRAGWRWAGPLVMAIGVGLTPLAPRPTILVSETGKLVAVRLADGTLALSSGVTEEFTAERWLRRNGQIAAEVWERGPLKERGPRCDIQGCIFISGRHTVSVVRGQGAFAEDCQTASVLISNLWHRRRCASETAIIARRELRTGGAHAIYLDGAAPRIVSVNAARGRRPWVPSDGDERR